MATVFQIDGLAEARSMFAGAARKMRTLKPVMAEVGEEMLARTQDRMSRGVDIHGKPFKVSGRASREGGQTLMDQGELAARTHYQAKGDGLDLFSSDKRARVHNEGLTITPKKAKFLTIPLSARGGSAEGGVSPRANRRGARARDYTNTFFRRKGGRLFLFQKTHSGTVRALFLLVSRIEMPKREFLGFSLADLQMVEDRIEEYVTGEGR